MATILPYEQVEPKIAEDVFLAPNVTVIGDVEIGRQSSIWFGTVIRGDVHYIRIGDRTNIQDNSVVHVTTNMHPTIVGDDVTVGHRAILHGCTIEDGALIGMGAIVMDRAVIGSGALVAAGALVTEGTEIPPGTLALGAPARPIRELKRAESERLQASSHHYARLAHQYVTRIGKGH